jgi:integrase/recombinase XerD
MKSDTRQLVPVQTPQNVGLSLPAVVVSAGEPASIAWEEFFSARIRNAHTRAAYSLAVRRFLAWLPPQVSLLKITPGMVGEYFNQHRGSPATRKLHLSAVRGLFDVLVIRHVMVLNPAHSVRGERYTVIEGKTPEIPVEQVRALLKSIEVEKTIEDPLGNDITIPRLVGLRDRAIIGVLIYTAARAGAVAKLQMKHFSHDGTQWTLHFDEKGGKQREIPVRHDLQKFILEYLATAGLAGAPRDTPLFRSAHGKTGNLTENSVTGIDICRMVKRRLKNAGLSDKFSPHSFRVTTVTDLLTQGVALEDVQYLAGHADPRVTRLYDRRQKHVTRNTVERISI